MTRGEFEASLAAWAHEDDTDMNEALIEASDMKDIVRAFFAQPVPPIGEVLLVMDSSGELRTASGEKTGLVGVQKSQWEKR